MPEDGPFAATSWHGEPAFIHEGDGLRVVVLERGGKLASLYSQTAQREWLLQPQAETLPEMRYGADFVTAEMCGWDEMAPSIVATRWTSAEVPDHGEAWSQRWSTMGDDKCIVQRVQGRAVPFALERTIRVTGDGALTLDYTASTLEDSPVDVLWAAHPQFRVSADDVLELDAAVSETVLTHGAAGGPVEGPVLRSLAEGESRKRWLRLGIGTARASIAGSDGAHLRLEFDTRELPYLGLWEDHVDYASAPVLALEPSNGWYDDLALAASDGRCARVSAGEPVRWSLRVSLGRR